VGDRRLFGFKELVFLLQKPLDHSTETLPFSLTQKYAYFATGFSQVIFSARER
jgi:hypothetical protein